MDHSSPSPSSLPATLPSIGELSAEFAKRKQPPKSPPLAFEKTPNDALAPLTSPPQPTLDGAGSSSQFGMGRFTPPSQDAQNLQAIVDQQNESIDLLHHAFAAERRVWTLEKERLHQRVASLEKLLKMGDGYSPAKSPVLSPFSGSNFTSPQSKATSNSLRLPSIAEDESIQSLSQRREGAPQSIDLSSSTSAFNGERTQREGSVSFAETTPTAVKIDEIPSSPPQTSKALSPPPYNYRMDAGHTPLKAPRPPTPPNNSMSMDGIEDIPTRNNTHINAFLTRSNDEDEDKELKGPLNMPELPNCPDEANFTFEMLSRRLEQIENHPEDAKPMLFAQPSPGLASPAERADQEFSPKTVDR